MNQSMSAYQLQLNIVETNNKYHMIALFLLSLIVEYGI